MMSTALRMPADARGPVPADRAYLCARLWARVPQLLTRADGERLRACRGLGDLFHELLATDYAPLLKERVLDVQDLDDLEGGLTAVFAGRVQDVQALLADSAPAYRYLAIGVWDLHHLRTLVRRVLGHGDAATAQQAFVPVGTFTRERYAEALAAESLPDLIARVAPWLPDWAPSLRSWLAQRRGAVPGPPECDLWLDGCHLDQLRRCAARACDRTDARLIRDLASLWIDTANLRTSLRFLGRQLPAATVSALYLAGGTIGPERFGLWMAADAIEQIYHHVPRGPLAAALEKGMLSFVNVGRASVFERFFDEQRLRYQRRLARRHPVSVAVPAYYLGRVWNEWINVRMIARGIRYQLPAGRVQESLVDV